jgi:hypothetical protein
MELRGAISVPIPARIASTLRVSRLRRIAELLSLMPCFRQHSQQRHRAPEGIRGRLAKLGRYESDEAIEPGEPGADIVRLPDGHRQAAVIGRLADWLKHSPRDLPLHG